MPLSYFSRLKGSFVHIAGTSIPHTYVLCSAVFFLFLFLSFSLFSFILVLLFAWLRNICDLLFFVPFILCVCVCCLDLHVYGISLKPVSREPVSASIFNRNSKFKNLARNLQKSKYLKRHRPISEACVCVVFRTVGFSGCLAIRKEFFDLAG